MTTVSDFFDGCKDRKNDLEPQKGKSPEYYRGYEFQEQAEEEDNE